MTIRSFIKRLHDFVQYRNATRDMNTRYSDATAEELARENTCIVCREEMRPWTQPDANAAQAGRRMDERQRAKKLPCGHILHFSCLRSWLERQQVCPTCRRPVLAQTGTQATQHNNAAGQNQQNQQNPQNQQNEQGPNNYLQALLQRNAAQGAGGAQGQPQQPAPAGQQNAPQGNLRVFNLGPFRIAMGNLRLPADQQGNPNHIRDAVNQLRQQAAGNNTAQNVVTQAQNTRTNNPDLAQSQASNLAMGAIPGSVALHPADIQSDILRIQQNIIESLRQLNAQHEQLEVVHRLLGELNRIQQSTGASLATGQELPPIAPLNAQSLNSFTPQAYFPRGPVLRQGDDGVPSGLTLPEGWTLRPMALAPRSGQDGRSEVAPSQASPGADTSRLPPSSSTITDPLASNSSVPESSASASTAPGPSAPGPQASSSPEFAEPSSLASSWSFGNVPERIEAVASGSAVAGSSSGEQNVTRRTVTVEDVEDPEQ